MTKYVTVYGASSSHIDEAYKQAAYRVGMEIARAGAVVVNGGGARGLMGATIDGAIAVGGHSVGVIPDFMAAKGWGHPGIGEMRVTDGMHPRKRLMADLATGVIALPGGIGTLDELMEIITWRQLGLYDGNIVILNTLGYYDPLLSMLDSAAEKGFMRKGVSRKLFHVTDRPDEAVRIALGDGKD